MREKVSGLASYLRVVAGGTDEPLMAVARRYGAKCQKDYTGPEDICKATPEVQMFVRADGRKKNKAFMTIENEMYRELALRDHAEVVVALGVSGVPLSSLSSSLPSFCR